MKKTYLFMMFFITSFFSISPRQVRWLLPYIIKNNSSDGLQSSSTNVGLILDQCNGKSKLITHLCCPFRTNYRSSPQRCSMKKGVLEISQNSQEKTCTRVIFLNKVEHLRTPLDDCFYNHLDLYRHLYCNNKQ